MAAPNKTVETESSVTDFLCTIADEKKRRDCSFIIELISKHSGLPPKMWGSAIVGFGSYHYKYESGREGDAPLTGLAARANAIVLYLGTNFENREELLSKFGKYTSKGGCVYIKKIEDIDTAVLAQMAVNCIAYNKKHYDNSPGLNSKNHK
jgi:hypothetical protein